MSDTFASCGYDTVDAVRKLAPYLKDGALEGCESRRAAKTMSCSGRASPKIPARHGGAAQDFLPRTGRHRVREGRRRGRGRRRKKSSSRESWHDLRDWFYFPGIRSFRSARNPTHPILAIGSPAPDFSLPGVDGKIHKLSDYAASPVLVIVFMCNHCPIASIYEAAHPETGGRLWAERRGGGGHSAQ